MSEPIPSSQGTSELERTFSEVYRLGLWGGDPQGSYYSGVGSRNPVIVDPYVKAVRAFVAAMDGDVDAVDLGCGDFNIGMRLCGLFRKMVACDIVEALVDHNRLQFVHLPVKFVKLDIVHDELPSGRIAFIRQVLQHLSNRSILAVVKKLYAYEYVVVTEHVPFDRGFVPNVDKPNGFDIRPDHGSGVVLTAPPFFLKAKSEVLMLEAVDGVGFIKTVAYGLR